MRLATKLVGWNIDIRSEEEIKKEVAAQMGAMIASGEPVPIDRLEGMTAVTTATLAEHGIGDIETLAKATVDDLVEFLDISLDQAEGMISAAQAVMSARDAADAEEAAEGTEGDGTEASADDAGSAAGMETVAGTEEASASGAEEKEMPEGSVEVYEPTEQHAASVELDPSVDPGEVKPSDESTAKGYDEAVEAGTPFSAEPDILAAESADPVAATEVEQMSAEELLLQGAGRDLRPDTITPAPDITSTEAAVIQHTGAAVEEERPGTLADALDEIEGPTVRDEDGDDASLSPRSGLATEASAPEVQVSSEPSPEGESDPAIVEDVAEDESENAPGNVE